MRLLVSVTREEEVEAAVCGGTDIVDVKNPAEGALGAAGPGCIARIRTATPAALPVSAALGDAPMLPGTMALAALGAASCGADYVKVGLYGPGDAAAAEDLLRAICLAVRERFPTTQIIAAGYADAGEWGAITPGDLPGVAARAGVDGCMLDTFAKDGRSLFDILDASLVGDFVKQCRDMKMESALAGSLSLADIPRILALGPNIVGVRSAVCGGDRAGGRVDAWAVARFKVALAGPNPASVLAGQQSDISAGTVDRDMLNVLAGRKPSKATIVKGYVNQAEQS